MIGWNVHNNLFARSNAERITRGDLRTKTANKNPRHGTMCILRSRPDCLITFTDPSLISHREYDYRVGNSGARKRQRLREITRMGERAKQAAGDALAQFSPDF